MDIGVESLTTTETYQKLLRDLTLLVRKAEEEVAARLNQIRVQTYWEMGKRISAEKGLLDGDTAPLFINNLSRDLNINMELLYRIVQFYKMWPDGLPSFPNSDNLSWTHYLELLSLKDPQEREFYLKTAAEKNWGKATLRKAIRGDLFSSVALQNREDGATTRSLKRDPNPLYTYKAVVERVIDGDTLLARIDLGFDVWTSQRLRFRGINTEELNDVIASEAKQSLSRAEKAKKFVEEKLKELDFVVVKTYKTDIYGRYVVDLFYHPTLHKKEEVANQGFFLNAQLLEAGLADPMVW